MNSNQPTVSVIIPTYNRADLLGRAIKSVLNQTFEDFELLVVDDCSDDDTGQVMQKFDDPRIKYITHQVNKGAPAARNTGIKKARGKYIAFLDSDDRWLPEKLGKQVELFSTTELSNVGLVYTGSSIFTEPGGDLIREKIPSHRGQIFDTILKRGNVVFGGGSSALVRKNCFDEVGLFKEDLPAGQDEEMWLRISRVFSVDFVKEVLVIRYKEAGNRITESIEAMEERLDFLYENYYTEYLNPLLARKRRSHWLNAIGHQYFLQGSARKGWGKFLSSIWCYPFSLQSWTRVWLALLGPSLYRKIHPRLASLKHKVLGY